MKKIATIIFSLSALLCIANPVNASAKKTYKGESKTTSTETASASDDKSSQLTGTFDITTNYMFRGISYSNNLPAFQGGYTYTFKNTGFYLSLWGSNVDFPDINGDTATLEIDSMAGITNTVGDHFNYNIYLDRYTYPKASGVSYTELLAYFGYYFLTAQIGYSDNVYDVGASGTYYNIGFKFDIPPKYIFNLENMNFSGGIGHYSLPHDQGLNSYNDYNLQLSKTMGSYVIAVLWTDTNGQSVDPSYLKNSHITATVTYNF